MKLPGIRYDTEVQSMGRYRSRAGELVVQAAQTRAEGVSQAGRMISEAERSAGNIIADAERNAARYVAREELANEKRKNDKIAEYKIQGAKLDIESKLAGDILEIRSEIGKYTLDRNYEKGLAILDIESGLKLQELGIRSQLERDKLDINEQLQLDILDIKSDQAWGDFLTNTAASFAKVAVDTFVQRQNVKLELKSGELQNDYSMEMNEVASALTTNHMVDINDTSIVPPDLLPTIEKELAAKNVDAKPAVRDDGTQAMMVPTNEVSATIMDYHSTELKKELVAKLDSSPIHQAELQQKLNVMEGKLVMAVAEQSAKFENEINKGIAENNVTEAIAAAKKLDVQEEGVNKTIIDMINNYETLGIFTPEEAAKQLTDANNEVWFSQLENMAQKATTKKALDYVRSKADALNMEKSFKVSVNKILNDREAEIVTLEADKAFDRAFPGYMAQVVSVQNPGGRPQHEVKAEFIEQISKIVPESEVSRLATRFDTNVNAIQSSMTEQVNTRSAEISNLQASGQLVPPEMYRGLPPSVQKEVESNNRKISKGHAIDTDYVAFDELRLQANPNHPDHDKFMSMDFRSPTTKEGTANPNWWKFNQQHRDSLHKLQTEARTGSGIEYVELEANTNAYKQAFEAYHGSATNNKTKTQEMLWGVSVVNARLAAWSDANGGKKPDNNTRDIIIEEVLTTRVEVAHQQRPIGGRAGYKMKEVDLVGSPINESVRWLAPAIRVRGEDPTYPAMAQLYNFLAKGVRAEGLDINDANLRYMYNKLMKSGINWKGF